MLRVPNIPDVTVRKASPDQMFEMQSAGATLRQQFRIYNTFSGGNIHMRVVLTENSITINP